MHLLPIVFCRRLRKAILAGIFCLFPVVARAEPAATDDLARWLAVPRETRPALKEQAFANAGLSKEAAEQAKKQIWNDHVAGIQASRAQEWKDESLTIGDKTMRFKQRRFGTKPPEGWSLFISLHGGGGAPAEVNDQQWNNQIQLYQPAEGIYLAPRAPTNDWNLWHQANVDALLERLLDDAFVLADVNPNRVYIMGYSAGGDGVYQLAPRMADRLAAASMMAGHPNDASPLGLRNIPFAIHVGADDGGYNRNKVALDWKKLLDDLHDADPAGYVHVVELHKGRGHWMNLEDKVAVPWMAGFTRNPLPDKVVWKQSGGATHDRFYWLAVPPGTAKGGTLVVASRKGQVIQIEKAEGIDHLTILLNDAMLDLDQPITVKFGDKELFKGKAKRTIQSIDATTDDRGDPFLVFSAEISVKLGQ